MQPAKILIYQAQQIREFERLALERFNLTGQVLMQRAGEAAFVFLRQRWPQAQKIAVFCGGGNNGGDGYVLASHAKQQGIEVVIWQVGSQDHMQEEARKALEICRQLKIQISYFDEKINLQSVDVIVDAICGIGARSDLREDILVVIEKIHAAHVPVLSMDIPTGIDADTGKILGKAVQATATMTFIGLKLGLLTGSGIAHTGELICHDLQLPAELFLSVEPIAEKICLNAYAAYLKPRLRDWHKGLSGHVVIIGGELGYSGAPRMAAEAALRVGAGLVSVATRPENALMMNITRPEIMCHGVSTAKELDSLLEKADVVVLGPGMGQSVWGKMLWEYTCQQSIPLVIDADGLNLLSQSNKFNENWVLTPHPGEAGRLIGITPDEIQQDRLAAARAINKRYGGICVLKGAGSIVIVPHSVPAICAEGNPGMASAGMGDVLSGVIGGLMAQGISMDEASTLGVCMHAMAGDLAAKDGERGMIATDLMPYLRYLSNRPHKNLAP
ncbi:MAG: NAD(P)H-hydrate dehydratase [Gammaproteobacteria bacterium]|nr:NAD(P)H-hydrate dehydratase [Gammaproteobacteria bacterium]MCW5583470.1 NAD(P)H-hydrate dehydratase [Gammaproteobacteria bacterium]